jgi:WD40 repeat protein
VNHFNGFFLIFIFSGKIILIKIGVMELKNNTLLIGSLSSIYEFDLESGKLIGQFLYYFENDRNFKITNLIFHENIIVSSYQNISKNSSKYEILIWDYNSKTVIKSLDFLNEKVTCMDIFQNLLFVGTANGLVLIYKLFSLELIHFIDKFQKQKNRVLSMKFFDDNDFGYLHFSLLSGKIFKFIFKKNLKYICANALCLNSNCSYMKICSKCKKVYYCSVDCQFEHFIDHQKICQ